MEKTWVKVLEMSSSYCTGIYWMPNSAKSRWWQLKYFLCSPRKLGKMNPFWLTFFRWVGSTTNQKVHLRWFYSLRSFQLLSRMTFMMQGRKEKGFRRKMRGGKPRTHRDPYLFDNPKHAAARLWFLAVQLCSIFESVWNPQDWRITVVDKSKTCAFKSLLVDHPNKTRGENKKDKDGEGIK